MYLAIVIYWFEIHYILFVHLSQYVCKCNGTAALQFKPHSLCILCGLAMFYYTLWLFLTLYLIYNICLAEIIKGCICQTHTFCTLAFLTFLNFFYHFTCSAETRCPYSKVRWTGERQGPPKGKGCSITSSWTDKDGNNS